MLLLVFGPGPASAGLSITLLYDNAPYLKRCTPDWGFACLIESGPRKILFDTGKDNQILMANAAQLDVDLKTIDAIVISHLHMDHAGGLFPLLESRPDTIVFLPEVTSDFEHSLQILGARYVRVEKPAQIGKGIFLSGAMGQGISEQALIINTPAGLVIVAGCSHPGIINMVRRSKKLLQRPVYLVLGGFHTMPATAVGVDKVVRQFRSLGVRNVAPAHCTDEKVKAFFRAAYKKHYITVGAGKTLHFSFRKK